MQVDFELVHGLPPGEVVERLYFHHRQGQIADRAIGFYLLEMQERNIHEPYQNAAVWARKNLEGIEKPERKLFTAMRVADLPLLAQAFAGALVPWTKIREVARVATPDTEEEWLEFARTHNCRDV